MESTGKNINLKGIEQKLKEIIAKNSKIRVNTEGITEDTNLITDLGFDSILIVRLVTEVELEFDFEFESQYLTLSYIGIYKRLRNYVIKKINEKA
jgi:acyl carrier protein